jgi:hypothetical protein
MIDILSAKYGESFADATIPMTEAAIKKLVGGKYKVSLLYNWDKQYVYGALVEGKDGAVVCGVGGEGNKTLTSLHPYWAQKYKRELSSVRRSAPAQEETLLGEIAEARAIAAERSAAPRGDKAKKPSAELG